MITAITNDQATPLSVAEAKSLADCESTIERGRKAFVAVGQALAAIRDGRLYRSTHDTFEEYCKARWDFGRSYASRLIGAAETSEVLLPIGNTPLPATESQMRPLLQFPVEDRAEVWSRVIKAVNGCDDITAKRIESVLDEMIRFDKEGPGQRLRRQRKREQREASDRRQASRSNDPAMVATSAPVEVAAGVTCPNCGHDQFDDYGDCARCHEPEVVKVDDHDDREKATPAQRGKCIEAGNACIDLLKKIGRSNPYRGRALEIVADWIEHNEAPIQPTKSEPSPEMPAAVLDALNQFNIVLTDARLQLSASARDAGWHDWPDNHPTAPALSAICRAADALVAWTNGEFARKAKTR